MKETMHETEVEVAKQETMKCVIIASCIVLGGLILLVCVLIWFNHVSVKSYDIYERRGMAAEIRELQKEHLKFKEHTHRYYDLKIKETPHD